MFYFTIYQIQNTFSFLFLLSTIFLNLIWIVRLTKLCWNSCKKYKTCKQNPCLHPVHSDVQSLSKDRILYNLKTHIVKNILIICCGCIETLNIIWIPIESTIKFKYFHTDPHNLTLNYSNYSCHIASMWIATSFSFFQMLSYNLSFILSSLSFSFLSMTTRYLTTRYLKHPFSPFLKRYVSWIVFKISIIVICSAQHTIIFSCFVVPFFFLLDWWLLLKENNILFRVLKSHLRELVLYSNSFVFYKSQLAIFKFYRVHRVVLLTSLLLLTFVISFSCFFNLLEIINIGECILPILYPSSFSKVFTANSNIPHPTFDTIEEVTIVIQGFLDLLSSMSISLPLWAISVVPIIKQLVRRCTDREENYRFNQDKLDALLKK